MKYVVSLSGGKDSMAMALRLMEEMRPITNAVFYDTGMEFKAVYRNIERITPVLQAYGAEVKVIRPDTDFLVDMLIRPVNRGKSYGYEWCGYGCVRWRTACKQRGIQQYLNSLQDDYVQYIGIAADEPNRLKEGNGKTYPLAEWGMTEAECLQYCYDHGYDWKENGVELYSILDRVSCWCCANKNLKELRNMRAHLPYYWELLKGMQSRIDRPFRRNGETIFDLDKRFEKEEKEQKEEQMTVFDLIDQAV